MPSAQPRTTALSQSVGDAPAIAATWTMDWSPDSCQLVVPMKIGQTLSGRVGKWIVSSPNHPRMALTMPAEGETAAMTTAAIITFEMTCGR